MKKNKYPYSFLRSFAALALLGIYCSLLLVDKFPGLLSYHTSDHQHEICTPELEKDSCHRYVFHNDKTNGCHHKTHFHPPKNNIKFFKALVASHILPKQPVFKTLQWDNFNQDFIWEEQLLVKESFYSFTLRGPPVTG